MFYMNNLFIIILLTIVILQNKNIYLGVYICGVSISYIIGILLKRMLEYPRPNSDITMFKLRLKNKSEMESDEFGMPSIHAIIMAYTTCYIIVVTSYIELWFVYILITGLVLLHQIHNLHHTVLQIIIGMFVGIFIAYISILISQYLVKLR